MLAYACFRFSRFNEMPLFFQDLHAGYPAINPLMLRRYVVLSSYCISDVKTALSDGFGLVIRDDLGLIQRSDGSFYVKATSDSVSLLPYDVVTSCRDYMMVDLYNFAYAKQINRHDQSLYLHLVSSQLCVDTNSQDIFFGEYSEMYIPTYACFSKRIAQYYSRHVWYLGIDPRLILAPSFA